MSACEILNSRGLHPKVASFSQLNSTQMTVLESLSQGKFVMTVEEHVTAGGFGSLVGEFLSTQFGNSRMVKCGVEKLHEREVGSQKYLRQIYGLDAQSLSKKFERLATFS